MTIDDENGFLGTWLLDPASCVFEQGDPPRAAVHRITLEGDELVITMNWTEASGETGHAAFRVPADGTPVPFSAGPLADMLRLSSMSTSELTLSASCNGLELMTAKRVLASDGRSLALTQTVHLPDFSAPTNTATYARQA
ncbi:MAG: hypothetical protein KKB37_15650 [Alphaproteobacteria bacterium]|nr:hypothetical protein [Alphaproteobacteria bacterium]